MVFWTILKDTFCDQKTGSQANARFVQNGPGSRGEYFAAFIATVKISTRNMTYLASRAGGAYWPVWPADLCQTDPTGRFIRKCDRDSVFR